MCVCGGGVDVGCHHYVNNSQLYISLPKPPHSALIILSQCLVTVDKWLEVNKLKSNPEREQVTLVG